MECNICLSPYNTQVQRPMVLPCGHTFCRECIEGILAATGECPNDRRPLNTTLANIPVNYDLLFAIEMLEKQQAEPVAAVVATPQPAAAEPSSENVVKQPPKVACRSNHELKWTSRAYVDRGLNAECDDCDKSILESWNCIQCEFDLCLACYARRAEAKLAGQTTPKLCPQKHPLWWTEGTYKLRGLTCECDHCEKSIKNSWHCDVCQYDLCKLCYVKQGNRRRNPPKCSQNHRLKWYPTPYQHLGVDTECDLCGLLNPGSWHCPKCRYDLCVECVTRQST